MTGSGSLGKPRSVWTAADLPSFSGRTVIVTGASSGLRLDTARELARVGATVISAVRNIDKGKAAAADMATDADFGARQTLYAVSQDLPGDTFVGPRFGYLGPTQPVGRSPLARSTSTARALWELSEQLTASKFPL
jgi:hypothetical protein